VVSAVFREGGARGSWLITADYELPGAILKCKELNSRYLYIGDTHDGICGRRRRARCSRPTSTFLCVQCPWRVKKSYSGSRHGSFRLPQNCVAGKARFLTYWRRHAVPGMVADSCKGESLGPDADVGGRAPLFYFMEMFPPTGLSLLVV
jgi:hypothetical protein